MLLHTRAIIFRAIKYGESSLILEVYTEARGIRKYIVSGVRKARSRTPASMVQPMNLVDIVAYERPGKELLRLKEVRPAHIYTTLPFEVKRGTVGLFMLEVARKAIREVEANTPLFLFLYNYFVLLDRSDFWSGNIHLYYLLQLTHHLGFFPAGSYAEATPFFDLAEGRFVAEYPGHQAYLEGERAVLLDQLLRADIDAFAEIRMSRSVRNGLLEDILIFYQHHVEGMAAINALKVLREVMA